MIIEKFNPVVTVIVPVFNRLDLLRATVGSLKAQTLAEAEFIVVDDQSGEETWNYLQQAAREDSRFRIVRKPAGVPRGCQSSRNIGLSECRSEFLMFLDSDDLLAPHCLETRLRVLRENPEVDMLIGRQAVFREGSGDIRWVNVPGRGQPDIDRFLDLFDPLDVPWVNGGPLIRTQSLREKGVLWSTDYLWDDLAFHFSCVAEGLRVRWMDFVGHVPDCYYRIHGGEHFGGALHTCEGIRNSARMMVWMKCQLQRRGEWHAGRRLRLARSFFHVCVLKLADIGNFEVAREVLGLGGESRLLNFGEVAALRLFIVGRRLLSASRRLTYFWNRTARRCYLRGFYVDAVWTYAAVTPDVAGQGICDPAEVVVPMPGMASPQSDATR